MNNKNKAQQIILLLLLLTSNLINASYLRGADQTILWNDSIDPSQIGYIPNVQYLGQGYNIYAGNPHSSRGLDPGFTNSPTVELDYQNNIWTNVNLDRSYFIPDGVRATVEKSCVISFSSKQITGLKSYRDSLSTSVEFQAKYFAGKFSASADYNEVAEGLQSSNTQFIESKARCSVFQLDLLPNNNIRSTPKLTMELQQKLFNLKFNQTRESDYHDFFDTWGTHVVTSINLGSRFGYKYVLDKSEANRQRQQGINLEASASYFGSSGSGSSSVNQDQIENFKKAMTSWSSYSIGAIPDADMNALKWAQQTLDTPMPIQTSIVSFDSFLTTYKSSVQGLNSNDLSTVITNLDKYLRTYCSKRLLPNNRIPSCTDSEVPIQWVLQYDQQSTNKKFKIQNYKSKKYWETSNGKNADGTNIQQWDFFEAPYQYYQVKKLSANTGTFVQKKSNKCIDYQNEQENAAVVLKTCDGSKSQQFHIIDVAPELFYLKSIVNNLYVTIGDNNNGSFFYMKKLTNCEGCQLFSATNITV